MEATHSRSMRPKQAADFLGIAVSTLWRWVRDRKAENFPQPKRLGPRTTVFTVEELASFRDGCRTREEV
jgi:predicted DNA-binding transcriptional regulator AlpA